MTAKGEEMVGSALRLRHGPYKERVAGASPITAAAQELVELFAAHDIPIAIATGAQRDDVLAVLKHSPVGACIRILAARVAS